MHEVHPTPSKEIEIRFALAILHIIPVYPVNEESGYGF